MTKNLIDLDRPVDKNYMILESLNQVKDNKNYKSIHVITLNKEERIIMGRGHEADVRINDISVSRSHGTIFLSKDGKIQLKDFGSKFGTLALIQNRFECLKKKVCLQIGRTYMEVIILPLSEYNIKVENKKRLDEQIQKMKE